MVASSSSNQPEINYAATGTLFEKMGGDEGIRILIDRVYQKFLDDPQLKLYFGNPKVNQVA